MRVKLMEMSLDGLGLDELVVGNKDLKVQSYPSFLSRKRL